MSRNLLGEFEHHVLLALLHQGEEGYSVPVVVELEERTGREISPAAVFIALQRLEKRGLVESVLRAAPQEEGGRMRRYYTVSEEAKARIRESKQAYLNLWEGLDPVLEES